MRGNQVNGCGLAAANPVGGNGGELAVVRLVVGAGDHNGVGVNAAGNCGVNIAGGLAGSHALGDGLDSFAIAENNDFFNLRHRNFGVEHHRRVNPGEFNAVVVVAGNNGLQVGNVAGEQLGADNGQRVEAQARVVRREGLVETIENLI